MIARPPPGNEAFVRCLAAAALLASTGCLLGNVGSRPDTSGEAELAAHRDTGCAMPHIKVLFDDYIPGTLGFADHHLQLDVCGHFKVYREGAERPHAYVDVTEALRASICSGDRAGVPAGADDWYSKGSRGVLESAREDRDRSCPGQDVRIVGHGWNQHVFSQIFEIEICGHVRVYRKHALGWGFYDATDEGIPSPCPAPTEQQG